MQRIIVGEFTDIKKIEKIIIKDQIHFGIFVDINELSKYDLEEFKKYKISIFIDDMQFYTNHYSFIQSNKDKIELLLYGRKIKRLKTFFCNEGYCVNVNFKKTKSNNLKILKNIKDYNKSLSINVIGNFEYSILFAEIISKLSREKILFMDTDIYYSYLNKRIKIKNIEDFIFIEDIAKIKEISVDDFMRFRKFYILCGGRYLKKSDEFDNIHYESLLNQIKEKFCINILYSNEPIFDEYAAVNYKNADVNLFIYDYSYENLIKINKNIEFLEKELGVKLKNNAFIAIKNKKNIFNELFIVRNLKTKYFISVKKTEFVKNIRNSKHIDFDGIDINTKKSIVKILNRFGIAIDKKTINERIVDFVRKKID